MPGSFGNGRGRPPSPEDLINEVFARLRGSGGNRLIAGGIALAIAAWLATGLYQVNPSEVGVVLRFGRVVNTAVPGLHWRIPWPVETVIKTPVTRVLKEEIGFRTIDVGPPARYRSIVEESRMLTADGNIVDVDFIVQYRIKDALNFLFKVRDPSDTLRDAAQTAMRTVIGSNTIDSALTEGRLKIQIRAQELLQGHLDLYEAGILITTVKLQDVVPPTPVQDSFKDVISAEQDKERMINEAQGFANDIVPKARGTAAEKINEAKGYAESTIKRAEGIAKNFELVNAAYRKAPKVTRKRMYLETMEKVLTDANKIILDESAANAVLPLLPLTNTLGAPGATGNQ